MRRVRIEPGVFHISRRGIDVMNPPTTTSKHLAINADWPKVERFLTIGTLLHTNLSGAKKVHFPQQNTPPLAKLLRNNGDNEMLSDALWFQKKSGANDFVVNCRHYISRITKSYLVCKNLEGKGTRDTTNYDFHVLVFNDVG